MYENQEHVTLGAPEYFKKVVWLKTETSKGKCGVFQSPADYGILAALPTEIRFGALLT